MPYSTTTPKQGDPKLPAGHIKGVKNPTPAHQPKPE